MRTALRFIMLLIGIISLSLLLTSIYRFFRQIPKHNEKMTYPESKKDITLNEKYQRTENKDEYSNVVRVFETF